MPQSPTANMGLVLPADKGDNDAWDALIDTLVNLVDQHDHSSGKGVKVSSAALNINADVSWASGGVNYAITDLRAVDMIPVAASSVSTLADAIFVNSADNNLYFRNHTGTNVQITSGSTLNVSIVGGIGGDYSSVAALLSYDDATRRYLLQQEGAPRPWAGLATADIDLYQKAASITNKVTLKSPNALAASYVVTFPGALPASGKTLSISSTGQIQYRDAVTKTLVIPAGAAMNQAAQSFSENAWASSTTPLIYSISLPVGSTIVAWRFYVKKTSNNTITLSAFLRRWVQDTVTNINSATNAANAPGYTTLSPAGFSQPVASAEQYDLQVSTSSGSADFFYQVEVDFTDPV